MRADNFREEVVSFIASNAPLKKEDIEPILEKPKSLELGDLAFPCFILAKHLKNSPQNIASELKLKFGRSDIILKVESVGPYLNFFASKEKMAESVLVRIKKQNKKYGLSDKKGEKVMIEYCSPNTNKALHLGHVRNIVLGSSVAKIRAFDGYDVVTSSLNNDRGVGVCEAMLGYMMFHKGEKPKIKPDHFVAQCYVDFKKAAEKDPSLNDKVKALLLEWEAGKRDVIALWKKILEWVYDGYYETYKLLGVKFDREYYESEIYTKGKEVVTRGLESGIFMKKDDAIVAPLESHGLPDKVLLKSDGTALYITQDIYLAERKFDDFKMDYSVYVVASEQDLHFRQLFKILELLGFSFAKNCYHLSYGMVNLPSGRMKSREGNVVDADTLITEVSAIAKEEIAKRHSDLSAKELESRSRAIALAAIKFFMVKIDPVKDFVFNPEESISFEGETGPYLQYAHARCCSLLKKYKKKVKTNIDFSKFEKTENLISKLAEFNSVVEDASKHYKPSVVALYLLSLVQEFSTFYNDNQIISDDKKLTEYRILLVECIKQVLENGLDLLGIEAIDEM